MIDVLDDAVRPDTRRDEPEMWIHAHIYARYSGSDSVESRDGRRLDLTDATGQHAQRRSDLAARAVSGVVSPSSTAPPGRLIC